MMMMMIVMGREAGGGKLHIARTAWFELSLFMFRR